MKIFDLLRRNKFNLASWFFLVAGLGITLPAGAQVAPVLKYHFFSMPPSVKSADYYHGIVQVEMKPEYKLAFSGALRYDTHYMESLKPLGIKKVRSVVPESMLQKARARRNKPFSHDLSLYQMIYFDPSFSVEEAINILYNSGMVAIAEPVYAYHNYSTPNDPLLNNQYYLNMIHAFEAWDVTTGDSTIVIGIPDTGVDIDHPDIAGNLFINKNDPVDGIDNDNNGYVDDWRGWDFAGASSSNPNDEDNDPSIPKGGDFSHGTGVGGIIGAVTNNGIGIAGIAQNCKLLFTKHYADDQPDTATSYAVTPFLGVLYCAMMGAAIINCSWGGPYASQIYQDYIDVVTQDLGVMVVASAGNEGSSLDEYPASYRNVISVGSVESNYQRSQYSNFGINVDIVAPGTNIWLAEYNNAYQTGSGTSFSSPMVAGAAALVKSIYPDFNGEQIGELLRVTADDTIYSVITTPGLQHKLGVGLLDIKKALTDQPPGMRLMDFQLQNDQGKPPQPGENATLVCEFKNYLWPSTGGLSVTLTSESPLLTVTGNTSVLGIINTNQSVTNNTTPFTVSLQNDIPENSSIDLLFEFTDGSYYDYQYASLLLNPGYINVQENNISSSVASNGRLGYQDTNQQEGLGLGIDGKNILFEMGLMLGTSKDKLSDCVRSINSGYDEDFVSEQKIKEITPGTLSQTEITGSFNDNNAGDSKSDVLVEYRSLVWKGDPNNNYFIMRYVITNRGSTPLQNFYAGLYADWDVSDMGAKDRADWDSLYQIGYVYNLDAGNTYYGGIQVLSGNPNYYAIENDNSLSGNTWGVYDGFTDQEKFESMSGGLKKIKAGFELDSGADVSHTVASGPYLINPDDSVTVAFAIHGAKSLSQLLASAAAADTMYNYVFKISEPQIPNDTICWNSDAILTASDTSKFNWYTDKTGGNPVYSGDSLVVKNLIADTAFYVSNAGSSLESVRQTVYVIVKANPGITISGSTALCEGDSVTLIANEADEYLWNPGGQVSRSITVTEAGDYSVDITDNQWHCVASSNPVSVVKYASPVADFVSNIQGILKDTPSELLLTDKSTNAVSWNWELSDGQTSNLQNPEFTINSSMDITVLLTVTSRDGCQGASSQVLTITEINDPDIKYGIRFYPVPAVRDLTIQIQNNYSGPIEIDLVNSTGNRISYNKLFKNSNDIFYHLPLEKLYPGLYFLKVKFPGHKTVTGKIIKE